MQTEAIRERDRKRSNLPHRIEQNVMIGLRYKARYPERYKATTQLNNAVYAKKITKLPCFYCGATKVVGHHVAYDLPLDVVWLCQIHHKEVHKLGVSLDIPY